MLISVGHLAKTYGVLPSEVLSRATTFDIMVTDILMTWERYQQNPAQAENYQTDDLLNILKETK